MLPVEVADRDAAYAAHLDRVAALTAAEDAREAKRRHTQLSHLRQSKGIELLRAIEVSPSAATAANRLVDSGIRNERMILGLPAEHVHQQLDVTAHLGDDEAALQHNAEIARLLADDEAAELMERLYLRQRVIENPPAALALAARCTDIGPSRNGDGV